MTHDKIARTIENANARLLRAAIGTHRFVAADDCTAIEPTLAIVGTDGVQLTTISAYAIGTIMEHGFLTECFASMLKAALAANTRGILKGRLEMQAQAPQPLGEAA